MRSADETSRPNLGYWALIGVTALIAAAYAIFVVLNLVGLR